MPRLLQNRRRAKNTRIRDLLFSGIREIPDFRFNSGDKVSLKLGTTRHPETH